MKRLSPSQLKPALLSVYREALVAGTSYQKLDDVFNRWWQRQQVSETVEERSDEERKQTIKKKIPAIVRFGAFAVPIAFISVGLFLMGNALIPIGQYYLETLPTLARSDLTTPIPRERVLDITPVVIAKAQSPFVNALETGAPGSGPIILDTKLDYTNLSNWFGEAGLPTVGSGSATIAAEYHVDIPKLNISNALVKTGSTNLNESLIQYPGTAAPGDPGAPVIFGHSVLRQFYSPSEKNPRRYVSIFSTIMTLQSGDEIFITNNGVKYKYLVREKSEVKPEDVFILTQNYDSKLLKLVTCTPEGTYLRRGVVTAQLVSS